MSFLTPPHNPNHTMYHAGIEQHISSIIEKSVSAVLADLNVKPPFAIHLKAELEIPKDRSHGDLATNIAMKASKAAGIQPLDFANLIKVKLDRECRLHSFKGVIDRVETKHPGFINFFLSKNYLCRILLEIKRRSHNFGRSGIGRRMRLHVEFVSANPTGPLTIAHGRQAAIGDGLANILEFLGYRVVREYYLNDEGTQMNILGNSIRLRYLELLGKAEEFPQDFYKGTYVIDIARAFKKKYGRKFLGAEKIDAFREFGLCWILNDIKKDLKDFGVKFNVWYSQKALMKSGRVERTIAFLKDKGYIYEKEGAVWFKSTAFGDDKDRVVKKTDGNVTYLAPDIAYHLEKYRRGFKKIIDIWGPDHHGYIPRMKAAIQALGFSADSIAVLIVQLATLYRAGQAVSMSTRAGEFITLREVMDEVGKDVARFCFISRRISSHLDFDLDSVKKESMENPVYYIQYAHARIWSILEHGKKAHPAARFDSRLLREPEEIDLLRMLEQFPMIIVLSGKSLEPYIIMQYLQDVATVFHSFYTKHRVISDDPNLTKARIVLVDCVRIVLANGLRLLGVSLPKKM
ncbi:MAG: arginine--tRNA ligase [Candidatus Omnitrophota bacterium]|nr:arginine--tRNA ligase [Candidatus Omnitrophota bacterium]